MSKNKYFFKLKNTLLLKKILTTSKLLASLSQITITNTILMKKFEILEELPNVTTET